MVEFASYSNDIYSVQVVEGKFLLVTLNRPKALNSVPSSYHKQFFQLWQAFEDDEKLLCAILTGTGRVFSAGADLKDWLKQIQNGNLETSARALSDGFMGISDRSPSKPIIAALNGSSYGGGTEVVVNCDLAVACKSATLSLPEVRRGVTALAGALPRIGRHLGLKRAVELALVGEPISAEKALDWGLINAVVERPEDVVPRALEYARSIALGSPEAIQASLISIRRGVEDTKLTPAEQTKLGALLEHQQVQNMSNVGEGLLAFQEKRSPNWQPAILSKL